MNGQRNAEPKAVSNTLSSSDVSWRSSANGSRGARPGASDVSFFSAMTQPPLAGIAVTPFTAEATGVPDRPSGVAPQMGDAHGRPRRPGPQGEDSRRAAGNAPTILRPARVGVPHRHERLEPGLRSPEATEPAVWMTVLTDSPAHWLHLDATSWRRWVRNVVAWVRQIICTLRGHTLLMHFESQRICLECSFCGHQTPGWDLGQRGAP